MTWAQMTFDLHVSETHKMIATVIIFAQYAELNEIIGSKWKEIYQQIYYVFIAFKPYNCNIVLFKFIQ